MAPQPAMGFAAPGAPTALAPAYAPQPYPQPQPQQYAQPVQMAAKTV